MKIDVSYTRMLHAVTNKSWRDHLTNEKLYGVILKKKQKMNMNTNIKVYRTLLEKQR